MAQVTLTVGGRRYDLACRDGEEEQLRALAAQVDAKVIEAGRALGTTNEGRQMLMAALLLADELNDLRSGKADPDAGAVTEGLTRLAARIETLAERLEKSGDAT